MLCSDCFVPKDQATKKIYLLPKRHYERRSECMIVFFKTNTNDSMILHRPVKGKRDKNLV